MSNELKKLPTLAELVEDTELSLRDNKLTVLLNQSPPDGWLADHPMIKGYKYIPIQRVEWLMTRIYGKFQVEVKDVKILANSVCVTVKVMVTNPITNQLEIQEGVGACPIQTDKGAGAMDWNSAKADGVMKALPAAKSYAFKDACESFGKIFGKDLGRKDAIGYDSLLKESTTFDWDALIQLYSIKKDNINENELEGIERVINSRENTSYIKLFNYLKSR